jgi:hypothetical protein
MKTTMRNILKKTALHSSIAIMALGLTLTSCKKDENNNNNNNNNNDPSSSIQFGDGTLVAVRSETVQSTPFGDVTITLGTGIAAFSNSSNYSSLADAGNVSLNSESLQKQSNNSYVFTPGVANPTGIDFSGGINWSVAGNSASGVPAFTHTVSHGFPNAGNITSGDEVSKGAGFTITISNISNADSVYFLINDKLKSFAGNVTTASFSAADLSGLSKGQGIITVAPWKFSTAQYGGKNFYFVTETVKQKSVTIVD